MKQGQLVKVTTKSLGGGEASVAVYAVAHESPKGAVEIIRKALGILDENVEAVGPIQWAVLTDQFALKDGEFTHL